jgi:hypothetical protein
MIRTILLATPCLLAAFSHPAHAGQPVLTASLAPASATATPAVYAPPAAADKVYPPLPTLAMLPPTSAADDDEPLAPKRPSASKKRKAHPAVDLRPAAPAARLVVSDASRTYLHTIDRQLDLALAAR